MSGVLSEEQVDAVGYIEQCWYTYGSVPTPEKIAEATGIRLETVRAYFRNDSFREILLKRGIDLDPRRGGALLTAQQLNLANRLLNPSDKMSQREKLDAVGVSPQQFYAWLRQPGFQDYLRVRAEELFKGFDFAAYLSLMEQVEAQDVTATKLFFEMRGIYNPKVTHEVSVELVLARVVEVVSKHVKDPAILQAIADELESLEGNRTPVQGTQRAIEVQATEAFAL